MHKSLKLAVVMLALLAGGPNSHAAPTTSNLEREKSWADQIVDTVVVGEPVWLKNRGHKFLALHATPARPSPTAIILLHGRGVHPGWGLIEKLYRDLAESGYYTLSLQVPILGNEANYSAYGATFPEALERIDVGVAYLRQRHPHIRRFILIGHSSGANIALARLARRDRSGIAGAIAISFITLANGPDVMQPAFTLKTIQAPLLDIYGGNDLSEVTANAAERRVAAEQAGNRHFRQRRVPDANHFFSDHYPDLLKAIQGWLGTPGKP